MWHYIINGLATGPVDTAALRDLLAKGALGPDPLVWRKGMPGWTPANSLPELSLNAPPPIEPPPLSSPSGPPPFAGTSMDPDVYDIEHNKVFAVLAYVGILFLVPLLAAPHSRFARHHANQGVVLFLTALIGIAGLLPFLMVPFVNLIVLPVWLVFYCGLFILMIIGIIHAASGSFQELPLIGRFRVVR